jgi:hypothetical protein
MPEAIQNLIPSGIDAWGNSRSEQIQNSRSDQIREAIKF